MILTHAEHNSLYLAGGLSLSYSVQPKSDYITIRENSKSMRWALRHTDIAAREGRGGGGTQQILYTIFAYNFVSVLTAGNPHCHKLGISHNYRTLSRQVRGWTSGRSLPV